MLHKGDMSCISVLDSFQCTPLHDKSFIMQLKYRILEESKLQLSADLYYIR